jgi:hypothetical protein
MRHELRRRAEQRELKGGPVDGANGVREKGNRCEADWPSLGSR